MMNRRRFLIGGVSLGLVATGSAGAYLVGGNNKSDNGTNEAKRSDEDIPADVEQSQALAKTFYQRITEHFDARVFITREGNVVMEYTSDAEKKGELQTEFNQIADLYAQIVIGEDYEPTTLSIVVGSVQAIVPKPSLQSYANGNINNEAYLETIEVTEVERNEN